VPHLARVNEVLAEHLALEVDPLGQERIEIPQPDQRLRRRSLAVLE